MREAQGLIRREEEDPASDTQGNNQGGEGYRLSIDETLNEAWRNALTEVQANSATDKNQDAVWPSGTSTGKQNLTKKVDDHEYIQSCIQPIFVIAKNW